MTLNSSDWLLRQSYWLLRDWLKHPPQLLTGTLRPKLEPHDPDYLVMRTTDTLRSLEREIRAHWDQTTAQMPLLKPLSHGDLMTVTEWVSCVESGGFIDYDGFGDLATADGVTDIAIHPSDITVFKLPTPAWATHVMWYNR